MKYYNAFADLIKSTLLTIFVNNYKLAQMPIMAYFLKYAYQTSGQLQNITLVKPLRYFKMFRNLTQTVFS